MRERVSGTALARIINEHETSFTSTFGKVVIGLLVLGAEIARVTTGLVIEF